MGLLADWEIAEYAADGMIEPFSPKQKNNNQISFGLSSYGYDVTASDEFKIFTAPPHKPAIDPKNFDKSYLGLGEIINSLDGDYIELPPHSFCLASTIEYIRMPRDTIGLMTVKSTYARCGIVSPPTVLEPAWEGNITIEISNTTPLPARIYANEGIAQVLFFKADEDCKISYADRLGKYQGQRGVTVAR